jgi:hypothetical protein
MTAMDQRAGMVMSSEIHGTNPVAIAALVDGAFALAASSPAHEASPA